MVYKENLVCVVKCNGQILREKDDLVSLPFGSEYSILLKNLNSRNASIKISIDGKDVLDDKSLIIRANSETELKGFLDSHSVKNSFKFIQKTKEIKDYRGDRIDDGIIRIEYAFEKRVNEEITFSRRYIQGPYYYPHHFGPSYIYNNSGDSYTAADTLLKSDGNTGDYEPKMRVYNSSLVGEVSEPSLDEGITVKGSQISQNFNYTCIGELDSSQVIIIRLRGKKINGSKVKKPITVKTKLRCSSCGKKSKSSSIFCSKCGTILE